MDSETRKLQHSKQVSSNIKTVKAVNVNDLPEGSPKLFNIQGSGVYWVMKLHSKLYYNKWADSL